MENLLKTLFQKSVELGDVSYSEEQIKNKWIGNQPASRLEIANIEKKLGVSFPKDYIDLLMVANGFKTSIDSVEPSFMPINEVDFFRNIDPEAICGWDEDIEQDLQNSILIAGNDSPEQQFLLIPPYGNSKKWKYWKFAFWIPGEEEYIDLKDYLTQTVEFLIETIQEEKGEK